MTSSSDRDAAAELAQRIEQKMIDPAKVDEAQRPPEDQPPAFADALMSEAEAPAPVGGAHLSQNDWTLISRALEHYAKCGNR